MAKNLRLVNFQQIRNKHDEDASVVVDPNGKEHIVGVVSIAFQLGFLNLQQEFDAFKASEGAVAQATAARETAGSEAEASDSPSNQDRYSQLAALLSQAQSLVATVLPQFPSDSLSMEELSMLMQAVLTGKELTGEPAVGSADEKANEEDGKSEPGESTRPSSLAASSTTTRPTRAKRR